MVEENDWLSFTNSLPSNPQRRFVETIKYNKRIVSLQPDQVAKFGAHIRSIHTSVDEKRTKLEGGQKRISNNAFKYVVSMIIDYGIKGY